jgi:hypothetical protein
MNPLQRAAFRRKVVYFGVILGLFTLSMFWRGTLPIPLSGARAAEPSALQRQADRVASRTVLNRAVALELREVDEGEPDLESASRQLLYLAGRGVYVAYLWKSAIDKQMRNDFHKMDELIRRVTKLQPHFITPWIFQSWNITYNVSVEMQGSGDMYYYIARGIDLLAEGERRQGRIDPETGRRIGSPDMRYQIAFYYQNKFGVSDNVEVLRCLFQMSCIPPDDRNTDAGGLTNNDGSVNLAKFEAFCRKYPHLVRRLRGEAGSRGTDEISQRRIAEALKCPRPEDVIQFLRDNKDVPSRFKNARELADADKQFPVLPPKFDENQVSPGDETRDDFSGFKAARAWFVYSTVPLPPQPLDLKGDPLPASAPRPSSRPMPGEYDPFRYRVPRQPMLIIFRQGAPRVQSFQAEMEQKEGWFDDAGWSIDEYADDTQKWFPDSPAPVVVGAGTPWSGREWAAASQMWDRHGYEYGLGPDAGRRLKSKEYRDAAEQVRGEPTPEQLEDPVYHTRALMAAAPFHYDHARGITNFGFFQVAARTEKESETVAARKTLWDAEQARKQGSTKKTTAAIIRDYRRGLELWGEVLKKHKDFHRPERSQKTDEDTYAFELGYLRLIVQEDPRVRAKAAELVRRTDAAIKALPFPFSHSSPMDLSVAVEEAKWVVAESDPEFSPFAGVMKLEDRLDPRNGGPWVPPEIKEAVRQQQGVQRAKPLAQQGPPPGAPMPGMPGPQGPPPP